MARGPRLRNLALVSIEAAAAIAAATVAVALLESAVPVTGLGVLYLLAVLLVASRHGELAALATAVGSVLALNFFFIEPRHQLTIAESRNVAALAVFLIAGAVVGRLAATARERTAEAHQQAREAAAGRREAGVLAAVASSLLSDGSADPGEGLRIELAPAPTPRDGERAVPLHVRSRRAWLHVSTSAGWSDAALARIAEPLARLVDVAIDRDEMAERRAEAEAARRADVAKTAVLHAISHDLRSPLTAISTATGALGSGPLSDDDRRELLAVLGSESARLARLVDDLLDLSRIEAGAVNPRPDWCDLRDTLTGAAEHVRGACAGRTIAVDLPHDLPLVRADAAQLERVFVNLLENAVKFSPPDSTVRVDALVAGDRLTVRVSDDGAGIPASARAHVFDPFFRGREPGSGSGLGLTICRGFVEANGGRIRLHARPGGGSTFAVTFAVAPQPVMPA